MAARQAQPAPHAALPPHAGHLPPLRNPMLRFSAIAPGRRERLGRREAAEGAARSDNSSLGRARPLTVACGEGSERKPTVELSSPGPQLPHLLRRCRTQHSRHGQQPTPPGLCHGGLGARASAAGLARERQLRVCVWQHTLGLAVPRQWRGGPQGKATCSMGPAGARLDWLHDQA